MEKPADSMAQHP